MIDRLSEKWSDDSFKVFATAVNRIEGLSLCSDHGAIFETTQHAAMWPALFQIDRLKSLQEAASNACDNWEEGWHDSNHPLWCIIGPDPGHLDLSMADQSLDNAVRWLVEQVRSRCALN